LYATTPNIAEIASDLNNLGTLRNIGISAHIDSGKTTLTERILYYTGRIRAMHEVRGSDDVGATMDSMELEKEKGITIKSAATYTQWQDLFINIIDTPGHVDFTIEVERALKVLDGAILLVCGASGVQSQTLTVDRQMRRYKVPRVAFINKLDRLGAQPMRVIEQINDQLGLNAALVQIPIGLEENFEGVVDVVERRALYFRGKDGGQVEHADVPEDLKERCEEVREQLVEKLIDVDNELADSYLEGETITAEMLKRAIRRATIGLQFAPVCLGSAFKNKGVQPLLDAVIDYLPDPRQRVNYAYDLTKFDPTSDQEPPEDALVPLEMDPKAPFVGLAFKITETRFGQLTWMRVYQGALKKGQQVMNMNARAKTRMPRLARMHADNLEDVEAVQAGDICAVFGVDCSSGDAFSDRSANLAMSKMHVPDTVVSMGLLIKEKNKVDSLLKVLAKYSREDPTFRFNLEQESGQIQISGMGELHLEIYCERLRREENIEVTTGKPYVKYRETVTKPVRFDYTFKKQSGGAGQYAKIIGYMEPIPEGSKETFEFQNKTVGQNLTSGFVSATKKGFEEACLRGPLLGNPVWGVRFVLEDGAYHQVDSNELAFRVCAAKAFAEAFSGAGGTLLQPIMKVEVMTPAQTMSTILSSLQQREGRITGHEVTGNVAIVRAEVPLGEMFGYTAELRSNTAGRGEASMEYSHHQLVEDGTLYKVLKEYTGSSGGSDNSSSSASSGSKKKK
jgi:elongation factor G